MYNLRVNEQEVIGMLTILVPDNQYAAFEIERPDEAPLKFRVIFIPEVKPGESPISWRGNGDILDLEFRGFVNLLGSSIKEPIMLGSDEHLRPIYLLVYHHKLETINRIDIQISLGAIHA